MNHLSGLPLRPGATIGILGGGQLGRMLAMAAARLGLKCHIYAPEPDSCAFDVAAAHTLADYDDATALAAFAEAVDVVTYEFENVPAETAAILAAHRPVLPDPAVLATTQDRLAEKATAARLGVATAPHAAVDSVADLDAAIARLGRPAVLKTRRMGYDGKGQAAIRPDTDLAIAWDMIGRHPAVLEAFVAFEREISVIVARGRDGTVQTFDVCENEHRNHILHLTKVPATIAPALADEARRIAARLADSFGYVGVMAVEMFAVRDGAGHALLMNEIAPRVHNSGHWTLDGCTISQFEQHIRAVAGWPLGAPLRLAPVSMLNLIGDDIHRHGEWLTRPGATVHIYGKGAPRPGRKMGHVTILG